MQTTSRHPLSLRDGAALPGLIAFAAAVCGRLPALGAWWSGSDWSRLAAAAGLEGGAPGWPLERLYWALTWPLFGLNADAHAFIRLGLHGLAAVLVVAIGARAGLGRRRRTLAGLVWAVA
ncbi:hypothetical protein KDM41_11490, partial [bacterium]|nr:hypothetical protein [bacterium]